MTYDKDAHIKNASWKAKAIARREEAEKWKMLCKKLEQAPNLLDEKCEKLLEENKALKKQLEASQRSVTKLILANQRLKKKVV